MVTKRILIVERDQAMTDEWRGVLEKLGYEVYCCLHKDEVVELARSVQLDLIIIGHHLPEINGIDIFRMIQDEEPNLVGILVLDEIDLNLVVQAMNNGFSRVLEKTLEESEFIQLVQESLDVARLREENTRLQTLLPLFQLGRKFLDASSVEQVYQDLIDVVAKEIHAPIISLMIFDKELACLRIVAARGLKDSVVESFSVRPGEKISGKVFEIGKPVIFNKQTQNKAPFSELLERNEISASILFPLISQDEVFGLLNISQIHDEVEYSQADLELLSVITSQAVMAWENVNFIAEHEDSIRTRVLLEQYMAPEVADLLIRNKKDIMEVGGIQEITVLYADMRNFTLLVQKLDLADLRHFLNSFFELLSDVVFSWKGTLDKFIGDAVLVVFGAPVELQTPSISAVFAARQILRDFDKLLKEWSDKSDVFKEVGLGIGISRGDVFLGNVGSSRRFDYTVIGTEVNIAQRLASQADFGRILITKAVKEEVGDLLVVQEEQTRWLKGIEKKIQTYSLGSVQEME